MLFLCDHCYTNMNSKFNYKKHIDQVYRYISHLKFHSNWLNISYIYFHFHILCNGLDFSDKVHTYQHLDLLHLSSQKTHFGRWLLHPKNRLHFLEIRNCSLGICHWLCWVHGNSGGSLFYCIPSTWDREFICILNIGFDWNHRTSKLRSRILNYRYHIFGTQCILRSWGGSPDSWRFFHFFVWWNSEALGNFEAE